jgi:putative transposase
MPDDFAAGGIGPNCWADRDATYYTWRKKFGGMAIGKSLPWNDLRSNGYNDRFNGTLRREVLNAEWFGTKRKAQTVISQSLQQYNQIQPHQAMRNCPPTTETILEKHQITGT